MTYHDKGVGLQALRDLKAEHGREARNLMDKAGTDPAEYAKVRDEVLKHQQAASAYDDQIRDWEKQLQLEVANDVEGHAREIANRTGRSVDEEMRNTQIARKAFANALRFGSTGLTEDEKKIVSGDALKFLAGDKAASGAIKNITEASPGTAGVFIPTYVMPQLLAKLKAFGGMREASKVLTTEGGNTMQWGTYDTTALKAAILAEGTFTPDIDVAFGSTSLFAFMYATGTVPISLQVLQDAAVNIEGEILDILSTALARGQNSDFTNGSGTGAPQGVVTAAAVGYTAPTGNTTTLSWDFLVQLYHSVDPAYRQMASARFMLNDATLKTIKLLKDTVGRPLWLPSTASSIEPGNFEPDTILGKPYTINQDMPSLGANNTPILFGAFEKYIIRDVMSAMILRFTDSAYARKLMVGFSGFMRSDGRMVDATNTSIQSYKCSAT